MSAGWTAAAAVLFIAAAVSGLLAIAVSMAEAGVVDGWWKIPVLAFGVAVTAGLLGSICVGMAS